MKRILFIINPIAGTRSKKDIPSLIKSILKGKVEYKIKETNYSGHASVIVNENLGLFDVFVAVGGDGTVNEVGTALLGTKGVLGIIPLGSGNGLARHLGVPLKVKSAIEFFLDNNQVQRIDTCLVNEQPYLMTSGIGFEAKLTQIFSEDKGRGLYTYIKSGIKCFRNYKSSKYSVEIDGNIQNLNVFTLSVANTSQYGNNTFINPLSDVQDGLLDVCILKPVQVIHSLDVLRKIFTRKLHESRYYEMVRAKKVVITSKTEGYHFDGEYIKSEDDKLVFEINPASLNVLVPN